MKKILFLITLLLWVLVSCNVNAKSQIMISAKKIEYGDVSITYPSVGETVDELFLDSLKNTYNYLFNRYHVMPTITYKTYTTDNYVSYLVNYNYLGETLLKAYNYDLSTNKAVYFDCEKIIDKINKNENKQYHLTMADWGFMQIIIRNDFLDIYLSKYLTNNNYELVSIPRNEDSIKDDLPNTLTPKEKRIAITFDDGPSQKTREIVDLLTKLDIKATFFVLGSNVLYYKDELKYVYDHNHEIGNHSYSHPNFKKLSVASGLIEIEKTQQIIYDVIKHYPRLFRFPYGAVNKELMKKMNLPIVLWSADSLDWKRYDSSVIISKVKKEITENGIILFHDFKYYNYYAIETIVNDLKSDGYTFVTLSELLEFKTEEDMSLGKIYFNK